MVGRLARESSLGFQFSIGPAVYAGFWRCDLMVLGKYILIDVVVQKPEIGSIVFAVHVRKNSLTYLATSH